MNTLRRGLLLAALATTLGISQPAPAASLVAATSSPAFPAQPNGKFTTSVEDMRVKVPGGYVLWTRDYDGNQWRINARWSNLKLEFDTVNVGFVSSASSGGGGGGGSVAVAAAPSTAERFGGTDLFGFRAVNPFDGPAAQYGPLQWLYRNGAVFTADDSQIAFTGLGSNRYVLRPVFSGTFDGTRTVQSAGGAGNASGTVTQKGIFREHIGAANGISGFRWLDRDGSFIEFDAFGSIMRYGDRNNIVVTFDYETVGGNRRVKTVRDNSGRAVFELTYIGNVLREVRDVPASGDTLPARTVRYVYNTGGSITEVTDVRGNITTYSYDSSSRLSSITDAEGHTQRIGYGPTNRMTSFTEADGGVTDYSYEYDKNKKEFFVRIKYPQTAAGRRVEDRWYSKEGVLRSVTVAGKTIVEAKNNSIDGRNVTYTDPRGGKTQVIRNEFDIITSITYPDGGAIRTDYDSKNLNVLADTDENGVRTQYTYDTAGNLSGVIEAAGTPDERRSLVTSDAAGNVTSWTVKGRLEADGSTSPDAIELYEYDADHNLTKYTDAEGKVTLYAFNRLGDVTRVTEPNGGVWVLAYDNDGFVTAVTDPLDHTVEYIYDKLGNLKSYKDARGNVTTWSYDAARRETALRSPYGGEFKSTYDKDDNLIGRFDANGKGTQLEYDTSGRLTKGTDAKGFEYLLDYADADGLDKGLNFISKIRYPTFERRYKFDERQRVTQRTELAGNESWVKSYSYDKVGRQRTITDANGKTRYMDYDALGQVRELKDSMGNTVSMAYNALGNLIKLTDPRGNVTRFVTDRRGLITSEIDPLGKTTRYTYDDNGWLTDVKLANGKRAAFTYDLAGRMTHRRQYSEADALTETVAFSYDIDDNLTGWSDGTHSGTLSYDNDDRLLSETVNYGTFSLGYTYTYYENNQVKTFTGPDGVTVTYSYDAAGQLERVSIPGEGDIAVTDWTWSSRKKVLLPGGASQEFEYDGLLDMTRLRVKTPGQQTLFELENKYGVLQEVKQRTIDGSVRQYSYDDALRLTGTSGDATVSYTLDAAGNRVGASPVSGAWVYDAANQLTTKGSVTYSYDDAGNLIRKVDASKAEPQRTTIYQYDAANRLIEVQDSAGSTIARYAYDPFDLRLSKEVFTGPNAGTTYYLHTKQGLVAEATAAGVVTTSYGWHPEEDYGTNALYSRVPAAAGTGYRYVYYHNDQLGTPYRITDGAGNLVWSATYDSFGTATVAALSGANAALAVTNNLRFGGQYYDAESGLHYNNRRYYETDTGRYITRDPLGMEGGPNQYLYVNHNPVNFYDPTGEILPCLLANYLRCVVSCVAIGKVESLITGCQVDLGDLALDCAKDCILSMIPLPNPCGKYGSYISMALGAIGASGGFNSFTSETLVHARNGQGEPVLRPISEMKVGDEVLAWSEWEQPDKALSYQLITDKFSSVRQQEFVRITLETGETIEATAGHPMQTPEGWRDAVLLKRGGKLLIRGDIAAADAERMIGIADVERRIETQSAFNLEVENAHTFLVGEIGAVAHNAKPSNGGIGRPGPNQGTDPAKDWRKGHHGRNTSIYFPTRKRACDLGPLLDRIDGRDDRSEGHAHDRDNDRSWKFNRHRRWGKR